MCGIAGIINLNSDPVDKDILKSMVLSIKHRGPDGEGYFFDGNVGMGHARLAIIDLTETGNQPMDYQGRYVVVHNGEIYNYIELRKELERLGYRFKSRTDTEVIPAAIDAWGLKAFEKFNGMWAFALYDKKEQKLILSRDRFGIKPFYYYFDGERFVFSSEIKAIIRAGVFPEVNYKILINYLITRYEDYSDETFFKDIFKLPQSHYAILDLKNRSFTVSRYYELRDLVSVKELNRNDLVKKFVELFYDSVKLRLRSDVRVGTCLSGGLDSSSVASVASRFYINAQNEYPFAAITAVSEDPVVDESKYAEMVVKRGGLEWIRTKPTYLEFVNAMKDVIYTIEEPFGGPSIFMSYFVMKSARENGIKVLLDGQGGDETLLGYERYYIPYLKQKSFFKKISNATEITRNSILSFRDLTKYYLYFSNPRIRLKHLKNRAKLLKSSYREYVDSSIIEYFYGNSLKEIQKLEITKYQLPHLLKYEDKTSMRHAVETRLPFLDYRLVEFALSLTDDMKINKGYTKYILRVAMKELMPNEIAWRKNKFGFEAPVKLWINRHKKEIFERISSSQILNNILISNELKKIKVDYETLWHLLNIAEWERMYDVRS